MGSPRHAPTSIRTQIARVHKFISSNPKRGIKSTIQSRSATSTPSRTICQWAVTYTLSSMTGEGVLPALCAQERIEEDGGLVLLGLELIGLALFVY